MNSSSYALNASSSLNYRDSPSAAVAKNVIVLALGFTINYINGTLIHTFRKHQVSIYCYCCFYLIIIIEKIYLNIANTKKNICIKVIKVR